MLFYSHHNMLCCTANWYRNALNGTLILPQVPISYIAYRQCPLGYCYWCLIVQKYLNNITMSLELSSKLNNPLWSCKNIGVGNVIFSITVLHIVLRINSLVILTAHCWHTSKGAAPHHQALTILCKIILVTLPRDNAQCNNTGFYDVVIVKICVYNILADIVVRQC